VTPFVGEPIIYQRKPNFRVQLPGNIAVRVFIETVTTTT
jgi:hypothetical protein